MIIRTIYFATITRDNLSREYIAEINPLARIADQMFAKAPRNYRAREFRSAPAVFFFYFHFSRLSVDEFGRETSLLERVYSFIRYVKIARAYGARRPRSPGGIGNFMKSRCSTASPTHTHTTSPATFVPGVD